MGARIGNSNNNNNWAEIMVIIIVITTTNISNNHNTDNNDYNLIEEGSAPFGCGPMGSTLMGPLQK